MPPEVAEQDITAQDQEQQQQQVQDDASFEAGFAIARGEEPPTTETTKETAQTAEEQTQETEQATSQEVPPATLLAGFTEDQIKDLLAKAGQVDAIKQESEQRLRQVFGKLGEINSLVQQMQQSRGSGVKLAADKLTRLNAEFPEMAEMLAADLGEALSVPSGAAFDPAQLDTLVAERLTAQEAKLNAEFEKRWLSRSHKDWQTVVKSPEFIGWEDTVLDQGMADLRGDSWDADFIAERLTEFKAWQAEQSVKKQAAEEARRNKQTRLEAAIAPQGAGAKTEAINDDEAFLAGFRTVRG